MDAATLATGLGEAGLLFQGLVEPSIPLVPPVIATFATSCSAEDGAVSAWVESGGPDLVQAANSAWYDLSLDGGLFRADAPQFLVAVDRAQDDAGEDWWWARVSLSPRWDVAGAGAASAILGHGSGHPAFVMLSLDGNVVVRGDEGQGGIEFVLVREPHRIPLLREHAEWMAGRPNTGEPTRAALGRWLGAPTP